LSIFMVFASSTDEPALKQFNDRVQKYLDIQKEVAGSLQPLSKKESDPALVVKHQRELASGIRAKRPDAAEGDIFVPALQPILLSIIKQGLASGTGKTARAMILGEGNPKSPESPAKVDLSVNAMYPSKAPASSVPPSLLLRLPHLPDGLEYRFVGRHLILRDAKADLIVDILRNAVR